ncbi:hypothetical protein DUNSADRAFT_2826, partial [Dunaliella salina]
PNKHLLLLGLVDGSIAGLDAESGSLLWTYSTGAPLVSVSQSDTSGDVSIFPGVDGSLYAYSGHNGEDPSLQVCCCLRHFHRFP